VVQAGLPGSSQIDMMKMIQLGKLAPFSMSADNMRNVAREVIDFWTEEENTRFANAIAMDPQKKFPPDWDVVCTLPRLVRVCPALCRSLAMPYVLLRSSCNE